MTSPVKSLPKSQRPREKLTRLGPQSLSSFELLALILGSGSREQNVLALSRLILRKFGTKNLPSLTSSNLKTIKGLGQAKTSAILATIELGRRIFSTQPPSTIMVDNLTDVLSLVSELRTRKKESLMALFLNSRNELISKEEVVAGGLNFTLLSPADLFRPALEQNASQLIVAHNHPSGNCEPSEDDLKLTARLAQAGLLLGIKLLDHVIIASRESYSLKERHPELFG